MGFPPKKSTLTRASGSYILKMRLGAPIKITVGKMGEIDFPAAIYYYVGSALNGNLISRVSRHVKPPAAKKTHWHIDYLLAHQDVIVEQIFTIPSPMREECDLAKELWELIKKKNEEQSGWGRIRNFGSSDCDCDSHLFYSFKPVL